MFPYFLFVDKFESDWNRLFPKCLVEHAKKPAAPEAIFRIVACISSLNSSENIRSLFLLGSVLIRCGFGGILSMSVKVYRSVPNIL